MSWLARRIGVVAMLALAATSMAYLTLGRGSGDSASAQTGDVALANATTASGGAIALQRQFVAVVKKVGPSVVQIENASGLGSGIVIDGSGDVVTNAHVVASGGPFTVTLANGKRYSARLVGTFRPDDLAVVKISASGLRPATFASSSKLAVGDLVLAIGNPLGLQSSVTDGIVSALGRTVSEENGVAIGNTIQTSAAINPGNSGGALVNLSGRVIGVPTLAATDPQFGGQAAGIGFAIPSDTVRDIASQLIAHGRVVNSHRAFLGIQLGDTLGGNGVYVGAVTAGGPAQKAGIKVGDIILSVAGKQTPTSDDLASVLADLKPGQAVNVGVVRADGSRKTVRVTLGEYPGST